MSANNEVRGNTLKIYLYLLKQGPSELRDIQRGVNLSSASLASYHLGKLSEAGFVKQDVHGRYLARVGPAVVPQLFFFATLFTILVAFFSWAALFTLEFTPYLIAVCLGMLAVFWYETAKLWRKLTI
jgi:hypothetical protein